MGLRDVEQSAEYVTLGNLVSLETIKAMFKFTLLPFYYMSVAFYFQLNTFWYPTLVLPSITMHHLFKHSIISHLPWLYLNQKQVADGSTPDIMNNS